MNAWATRNIFYPLYEMATGRRVLQRWQAFERTQWLSAAEIQALQQQRLVALIEHARQHVPYYRSRWQGLPANALEITDPAVLSTLPLVTKADILDHWQEMVAENYSLEELKLNATGGSTGHMLSFYNDRPSLDFRSAVTLRGDRWAGLEIGTHQARLWGAPQDLKTQGRLAARLGNWALGRLWLDCFRLSEPLMDEYIRALRKFRPQVLLGYATALAAFATHVRQRKVEDIRFKGVISSAETLHPEQRRIIEKTFHCQVFNRYGCREAGPLAAECNAGRLHISADYAKLEIIRPDGHPAAPGEMGEIVLTPLYGFGMPLVRYQVGDMGIAASPEPCPCGRGLPVIEHVTGRVTDMLINARGEFFHGEYFTHLFYNIPGVRQFQVVQSETQRLDFKLVTSEDFDPATFPALENKIVAFCGPMQITWKTVDEIPPLVSGKFRFTVSEIQAGATQQPPG